MVYHVYLTNWIIFFILCSSASLANDLNCIVTAKYEADSGKRWSIEKLEKSKFSVRLYKDMQILERCSFSTDANGVTCDKYHIQYLTKSSYVDMEKFYIFDAQYDIQIFNQNTFIENNRRGYISAGFCRSL